MMKRYIHCEDRDKMVEWMNQYGLNAELVKFDEYGFSRTIQFHMNGKDWEILWFKNICYLRLYEKVEYPFRYLYYDSTCPEFIRGGGAIAFSPFKTDDIGGFPFEVVRIGFNKSKDQ